MNCKSCGYGLKQSCGDFEKIICTYEEGECEKITELKAQIEKMKCCGNCKHFDKLYNRCELTRLTLKSSLCTSLDKWELRR